MSFRHEASFRRAYNRNDANIGLARIFHWRGANYKLHAMTLSEIFERGTFVGQKYCRLEDQKP